MTWLLTCEGREHHLAGPDAHNRNNVPTLGEISHSLAQINRFCGHCKRPYSVAEHSLLVADIAASMGAKPEVQLAALMHDAHECITGDVSTPIKQILGRNWEIFEGWQANVLAEHYELTLTYQDHGQLIKLCDLTALATERRDLLPWRAHQHEPWPILDTFDRVIEPWPVSLDAQERTDMIWLDWADEFEARALRLVAQVYAVPVPVWVHHYSAREVL
jgi:hypothetical protein